MKEEEATKRLKTLLLKRHILQKFDPMSCEDIAKESGVPLEVVEDSLSAGLSALAKKGVTEDHLREFYKSSKMQDCINKMIKE
jgi:hypothetical protein